MTKLKWILAALATIAIGSFALAQSSSVTVTSGFWPNWPLVGGASYSCGSVNAVSNCTVPAGPTTTTGNETIPANTGLSGGQTPQNVVLSLASLNSLPIQVQTIVPAVGVAGATPISASDLSGGIFYNSPSTITAANLTLPNNPINGQQYVISANRTITTLTVAPGVGESIGGNTNPTVLTASTTAPQGYIFFYNSSLTTWFRLR